MKKKFFSLKRKLFSEIKIFILFRFLIQKDVTSERVCVHSIGYDHHQFINVFLFHPLIDR